MEKYTFKGGVIIINDKKIIRLPKEVSEKLLSRGFNMAYVRINEDEQLLAIEPDGLNGHWFFATSFQVDVEESLDVSLRPTNDWTLPHIPDDMAEYLEINGLMGVWERLTVKAKWSFVRWIRSTASDRTRQKRIEAMIHMLKEGKKRPCCFNHQQCSITDVSKSGVLCVE